MASSWLSTSARTQASGPTGALTVGAASATARPLSSTSAPTLGSGPTAVPSVARVSTGAQLSSSTAGPTRRSGPSAAWTAGRASVRAAPSSSTRRSTLKRNPTNALTAARASASAPTSPGTREHTQPKYTSWGPDLSAQGHCAYLSEVGMHSLFAQNNSLAFPLVTGAHIRIYVEFGVLEAFKNSSRSGTGPPVRNGL